MGDFIPASSASLQKQHSQVWGSLTLSWRHYGYLAGVRRVASDPTFGDNSKTVAILKEAWVRLIFL